MHVHTCVSTLVCLSVVSLTVWALFCCAVSDCCTWSMTAASASPLITAAFVSGTLSFHSLWSNQNFFLLFPQQSVIKCTFLCLHYSQLGWNKRRRPHTLTAWKQDRVKPKGKTNESGRESKDRRESRTTSDTSVAATLFREARIMCVRESLKAGQTSALLFGDMHSWQTSHWKEQKNRTSCGISPFCLSGHCLKKHSFYYDKYKHHNMPVWQYCPS